MDFMDYMFMVERAADRVICSWSYRALSRTSGEKSEGDRTSSSHSSETTSPHSATINLPS
jgi:hypothetical protein